MSWSISKLGKAGAVKNALVGSFDAIKKQYPSGAEHDQVVAAEVLIDTFLSPLDPSLAVRVEAHGSLTSHQDGKVIQGAFKVEASTIYGFVE